MADKYHSDTQEKIETLAYAPYLPTTGDKEPGTHTIVPTARPAIASAQYSHSLTLSKPSDARLVVKRIASRLNVNIAGLGTATHVYCSVRVDVDDTDHELFNEDWNSTGSKLDAVDTYDTNKAVIFNLLKDGAAHTFYFLFWADVASQATIDLVQLWEAVGSCSMNTYPPGCLAFDFAGLISLAAYPQRIGTGSVAIRLISKMSEWNYYATSGAIPSFLCNGQSIATWSSVATDIGYLYFLEVNIRNEQ